MWLMCMKRLETQMMCAQTNPVKMLEETGPDAARRMKAEGVDLVFMVPI